MPKLPILYVHTYERLCVNTITILKYFNSLACLQKGRSLYSSPKSLKRCALQIKLHTKRVDVTCYHFVKTTV